MTGVKLPIITDEGPLPANAVLLGNTRHTAGLLGAPADRVGLGNDGFRIVVKPPHILIVGGPLRGTLYGVYDVLERFGGCRWYASWHSVIPRLETFFIPVIDDTQKPAFALREPHWFDMFNGDFAARNKANGHSMRLTEKHGGNIRFGNGFFVHTFIRLCPPEKYFDTFPEYFSEVNGNRVKEDSQLCLTNPDVLKLVTENLLIGIRKDPTAKLFSVSQNDCNNFCTCPTCKALDDAEESHAGTMITFVNKVAEAVEKEFPDVWIETLAYTYTRKPPKTVRPRHNVVVRLCTIESDFSEPLDQSPFEENEKFVEDLRTWSGITDKLYVWDYTTNFREFIALFPNVMALQGNIRLFRDNKVIGVFEQGDAYGRHADFAELKTWLLAKWLWNPDLSFESLLDDFFDGYYGAAAPFVKEYFTGVHAFYKDPTKKPLQIYENIRESDISDAFLARAAVLWQQAEDAVKDSPAYSYNVRMGAIPVLNALLARNTRKVWVTRTPERFSFIPPPELRAFASELVSRFDEAKNIRIKNKDTVPFWRAFAADPLPVSVAASSAMIEDTLLYLYRPGIWCETVKDPLAVDGSALKIFNTHHQWCTRLYFSDVAFDRGEKYRLRMRARVEKKPGHEGEAFWAGVYDAANKRSCGNIEPQASQTDEGYAWYDVAEWIPDAPHFFWAGPGRFDEKSGESSINAVYIDKLELSRVEP